eukprot:4797320-Pyramimonas_sp.AAC.1
MKQLAYQKPELRCDTEPAGSPGQGREREERGEPGDQSFAGSHARQQVDGLHRDADSLVARPLEGQQGAGGDELRRQAHAALPALAVPRPSCCKRDELVLARG